MSNETPSSFKGDRGRIQTHDKEKGKINTVPGWLIKILQPPGKPARGQQGGGGGCGFFFNAAEPAIYINKFNKMFSNRFVGCCRVGGGGGGGEGRGGGGGDDGCGCVEGDGCVANFFPQ